MMNTTSQELRNRHCTPCEGGVPPLPEAQSSQLLAAVSKWNLSLDGKRIHREWQAKDFASGLDFIRRIGELAEAEGHHPDLHLTDYRQVTVELTTHAVEGLTENDFILAARIDALPLEVR